MKKMNIHKMLTLILFVLMMSGFSLLGSESWDISTTDRTLWIKMCDSTKTSVFTNDLNNSTDTLGTSNKTGAEALDSVIADYNAVNSSYLRLAKYPDDPNNPGNPATGDSTFTISKASTRTISLCIEDAGGVATGGYAKPKYEQKKITSCTIVVSPKNAKSLRPFVSTLTHEIGHCLGLDHPMETTNAIMSYFHPDDKFRLMTDDKMGLVFLYPKSGVDTKEKATYGLSCKQN